MKIPTFLNFHRHEKSITPLPGPYVVDEDIIYRYRSNHDPLKSVTPTEDRIIRQFIEDMRTNPGTREMLSEYITQYRNKMADLCKEKQEEIPVTMLGEGTMFLGKMRGVGTCQYTEPILEYKVGAVTKTCYKIGSRYPANGGVPFENWQYYPKDEFDSKFTIIEILQ